MGAMGRRDGTQRGLTMVELLVTIVLSGLFFAAMVPVFVMASQQSSTDRARILATNTVQSAIERLRDLPYDDLYDTDWSNATTAQDVLGQNFLWKGPSSNITINKSPYPAANTVKGSEDYLIFTVTATWTGQGGKPHSTSMKTAIYRQGLATETLVLLVYPLTSGYIKDTPVTVSAQLNAADFTKIERVDFTIYANNGTRIEEWSVYSAAVDGHPEYHVATPGDGSGTWYYDHPWDALGPSGETLADGHYSFVAKTVPVQPVDGQPVLASEWARKEYVLNRSAPGQPIVDVCKQGFYKSIPTASKQPFVHLEWHLVVNTTDLDHFEVTRLGTGADGSALPEKSFSVPRWATECVDRDVVVGNSYRYKVRAQDAEEAMGAYSELRPVDITPSGFDLVPQPPAGPVIYTLPQSRCVTSAWGPSPSGTAVDAYRVYRVGADGVNLLIETIPVDPGATDPAQLKFGDIYVEYGETYTYFVTAVSRDASGFEWESATLSGVPIRVPEPPKVGLKVSVYVKPGVVKPTWARLMIHSLDTGNIIPANPWEYPTIQPDSSNVSKNTWVTGNILYPGTYQVIAVLYSKKNTMLGTASSEAIVVSAPDTPVQVPYLGPTSP